MERRILVPVSWFLGADGNPHPYNSTPEDWVVLALHEDGSVTWEADEE